MEELPSDVGSEERITRYILNKKHINSEKGQIKVDAFLPPNLNRNSRNGKLPFTGL